MPHTDNNHNIECMIKALDISRSSNTTGDHIHTASTVQSLLTSSLDRKQQTTYRAITISDDDRKGHLDEISACIVKDGNASSTEKNTKKLGSLDLIVMMTSVALLMFSQSSAMTTMTEIASEFQSAHLANWIPNAYGLINLMTIPTVGQLSKAFGSKSVWIALNIMLLVGSAAAAYSRSFMQVIASQAISGLGGGLGILVNVILHDTVPSDKLGMYISYFSIILAASCIAGAPVGGYISDNFGWRNCFKIVILPVALVLYLSIYHLKIFDHDISATVTSNTQNRKRVAEDKPTLKDKMRMVDFGGITLLSIPTASFMCAVSFGGVVYAWSDPIIVAAFVVSFLGYLLFFLHQVRWAKCPLLPRVLIRDRNLIISCLCCLLSNIVSGAALSTGPQYLMSSLRLSMTDAGQWSLLSTPGTLTGFYLSGRYMKQTGRFSRMLLACIAVQALTWGTMYFWVDHDISSALALTFYTIGGIGGGALSVSLAVAAISTLPTEIGGTALSMISLVQNAGVMSGIACSSAIIQHTLKVLLPTRIKGPDAAKLIEFIITSIRRVKELSPEIQQIVADIIDIATEYVILYFIFCFIFMFFVTLRMQNVSLNERKV